ncbi:redoxin domain-containing protein [Virgibacillus sp. 179-BFC.A HS]|uniref:Redoxin domain-containing protein n=1 Tax=Tigheibacillus jepli TaxID=3035914 RepID=A0ABU5CLZ3_9BACI|nr:redoxin domain-containing protein [Virgibacillus sp. 179-BFC.A HS]MDY0406480.1 redoxin domain-containing protein [Virgibacillus sp. 179-BFC.A HS]
MKKTIIVIVLVGMFGWAMYDLVKSDESADSGEEMDRTDEFESTGKTEMDQGDDNNQDKAAEETAGEPDQPITGLDVGNIAPDFELETLDGKKVKLSDFRGERVLLNFWATWCPPCRAEVPDLEKLYENNDVTILAVNLTQTEKNRQVIQDFVNEFDMTFPILLDEDIEVASMYSIQPIPTSFMIDTDGIIRNKAFGALQYDMMVDGLNQMK